MTQNRRRLRLRRRGGSDSSHGFLVVPREFLKVVCDAVWDVYLLKMSISEKTALATFKSLSYKYITRRRVGCSLVSGLVERLSRNMAVKQVLGDFHLLFLDLLRGSRQFLNAMIDRLD
jgi:hypothetical protein